MSSFSVVALESEIARIGARIAGLGGDDEANVYRMSWWSERLLDWAMRRPDFKTQLFRFVDVYPALRDKADVLRHLDEYFDRSTSPLLIDAGLTVADHVPVIGEAVPSAIARSQIARMGGQFIAGHDGAGAADTLTRLRGLGSAFTVDLLGEKTITESEADNYAQSVHSLIDQLADLVDGWPSNALLDRAGADRLPIVNVSVKPTALAPHFEPLGRASALERAGDRLREILRHAVARGAFVHVDMEHRDVKDLTLDLFRRLMDEEEFRSVEAGIVIQAYLRDSLRDLGDLVAWASQREAPVTVRLVKGAYWDTETVLAEAAGWESPVYTDKAATDRNYERCTRLLIDHAVRPDRPRGVRPAFGTHNLRSMSHAIAYARQQGLADDEFELQMLYGMAEPTQSAVRQTGLRLRLYCPVGDLVPGMAYLVRRLLENTSNESFLRHRYVDHDALDVLLAPPAPADDDLDDGRHGPMPTPSRRTSDADRPGDYRPEPQREWRRRSQRAAMAAAIEAHDRQVTNHGPTLVPAYIDGREIETVKKLHSVDPAVPTRTVAVSAACETEHADRAIEAAVRAAVGWSSTPARTRAQLLFDVAQYFASHRQEIAACEIFEAGKPWAEADADVVEAIDFCEYYGRQALRLDLGGEVQSPPSEHNRMTYRGKGPTVVIAPWNFPLAIPTGMAVAALAVGNPVILKPAEQTPATAQWLLRAIRAAGVPDGVFSLLPGAGETVGARLVEHPETAVIAFTGSLAVGLAINQAAAVPQTGQRHVKRVVAEMGGKNALIVDSDADLDQAIPAILQSAFGFAGQKCSATSRLIVHDAVYDQAIDRLVEAASVLRVGHPRDPGTDVGPVIDETSQRRLSGVLAAVEGARRVRWEHPGVPTNGWFAPPAIVEGFTLHDLDDEGSLASTEVFGPTLAVFRAASFDDAIVLANRTDFALTAGVFSRSPANLRQAATGLRAGNVYLNRGTTGAVVGRQPFGGFGLSGVGSKAGGPDYLLQFVDPVTVTENTLRQGFAPPVDS